MSRHRFLVTAGGTRECIDAVREWTNLSTGETGLAIALALLELGDVVLLTGNADHARAHDGRRGAGGALRVSPFAGHGDLLELLEREMATAAFQAVVMAAAVADYSPTGVYRVVARDMDAAGRERWTVEDVSAEKISSCHEHIAVLAAKTTKLIDMFRTRWNHRGLLIKFKLEADVTEEELVKIAGAARAQSGADYIVANTVAMLSGPEAGAWIIGAEMCERVARADLPATLARVIANGKIMAEDR